MSREYPASHLLSQTVKPALLWMWRLPHRTVTVRHCASLTSRQSCLSARSEDNMTRYRLQHFLEALPSEIEAGAAATSVTGVAPRQTAVINFGLTTNYICDLTANLEGLFRSVAITCIRQCNQDHLRS